MDEVILSNILILGGIAFVAACILYFVSQKFQVAKDEKSLAIKELLPQANCGGCGYAGCVDFAESCFKADEKEFLTLYCPVGGEDVMKKIAEIKGIKKVSKARKIVVLCCQGNCQNAPAKVVYEEVSSCRIAHLASVGESGCPQGCLHLGDCVKVCKFGALTFDESLKIPVVDASKCVACGACVKVCPRGLFEIRTVNKKGQTVYVACKNQQKGVLSRKNCSKACIGCMKCTKINDLVKVDENLSYIPDKVDASVYGEELKSVCPTGAIVYKGQEND